MLLSEIFTWLQSAPLFADKPLHLDFLPSRGGWSMSMPSSGEKRDILGTSRQLITAKIICRATVTGDSDRLQVYEELSSLTDWATQNAPEGFQLKSVALPQFSARDLSGMEDFAVTLVLTEN